MRISKTKQKQMKALRSRVAAEEAEQEREEYKARSYPEDGTQYFSRCCTCHKQFQGNKDRYVCRVCNS